MSYFAVMEVVCRSAKIRHAGNEQVCRMSKNYDQEIPQVEATLGNTEDKDKRKDLARQLEFDAD